MSASTTLLCGLSPSVLFQEEGELQAIETLSDLAWALLLLCPFQTNEAIPSRTPRSLCGGSLDRRVHTPPVHSQS